MGRSLTEAFMAGNSSLTFDLPAFEPFGTLELQALPPLDLAPIELGPIRELAAMAGAAGNEALLAAASRAEIQALDLLAAAPGRTAEKVAELRRLLVNLGADPLALALCDGLAREVAS